MPHQKEYPHYAEQVAFEEELVRLGLFDLSGFGPSEVEFCQKLEQARWSMEGFNLIRSRQRPDLDDLCGANFTYRQLIECGTTQSKTGLANLPREPESYTALYELCRNILDPVIEYFGMISLTYGFCSPALAKLIPGRIAMELDQHAEHERNRRGRTICARLGAAADFIFVNGWIPRGLPRNGGPGLAGVHTR